MFEVSFSEVIFQTSLLAGKTCGLLALWHWGKMIGENHSMLPGQDYFGVVLLCGIGAWLLHSQFGVELTYAWVAFTATGLASVTGLMKGNGLRHQKEYDEKADFNLEEKNQAVPTIIGFLISAGLAVVVLFLWFWFMKGTLLIFGS